MKIIKRVSTVDTSKCVGCRSCEQHCPSGAIKVRCGNAEEGYVSPCKSACPAGVDVQGYVALAGAGKYEDAYRLIRRDNPFPSVCGRICTHPCQSACNRSNYDAPVAIRDIKRFVSDEVYGKGDPRKETVWPSNGKSVGIIGAGPSGLSCAYYLALSGYDVDVYESAPVAGGVLLFGIPEYRLPKDVLAREVAAIEAVGVKIHLSTEVGKDISFEELKEKHDSIYISTGTQFSRKAGVQGEDKAGVCHGLDFLKDVNLGKDVTVGEKVVVIGGGNTAIDASRTAVRLGAKDVKILYRRRQQDMPADAREITEALEEGVKIMPMAAPVEFMGDGKVEKIRCVRMALGEVGDDGRRGTYAVEGDEFEVEADTVIVAVSQYSDFPFIRKDEVELTKWGLAVDENMMTSMPGVFSGGDVVRGSDTAITAIADGKKAAVNINKYLGVNAVINQGADIELPAKREKIWDHSGPCKMTNLHPDERVKSNAEVALGLTEEQVKLESLRCYQCSGKAVVDQSICMDCELCWEYCKHGAITLVELPEPRVFDHPGIKPDDTERFLEVCKKAHMYPNEMVCTCNMINTEQVVSAIFEGAKTQEDIVRMTGAKSTCGIYCYGRICRLMDAAGLPRNPREDGSWNHLEFDLWHTTDEQIAASDPCLHLKEAQAATWNDDRFEMLANEFRKSQEEKK